MRAACVVAVAGLLSVPAVSACAESADGGSRGDSSTLASGGGPGGGGGPASAGGVDAGGSFGSGGAASGAGGSPGSGGTLPRDAAASVDASPEAGTAVEQDGGLPPRDGSSPDASWQGDGSSCDRPGARFVTGVPSHAFGPGQDVGQATFPTPILGPPKGGGCCQGSTDVVSLGNGGHLVVEFEGNAIVDGPGVDFIVFENAFNAGGDATAPFAEPATVAVSDDGVTWTEFPCIAVAYPYGSCAGWRPVLANATTNDIDPLDPEVAGGDPFDLAEIGVARARFVRITDREDVIGFAGVFDLDAVGVVHAECP